MIQPLSKKALPSFVSKDFIPGFHILVIFVFSVFMQFYFLINNVSPIRIKAIPLRSGGSVEPAYLITIKIPTIKTPRLKSFLIINLIIKTPFKFYYKYFLYLTFYTNYSFLPCFVI